METEKTVSYDHATLIIIRGYPTGPVLEPSRGMLPGWRMSVSLAVADWPVVSTWCARTLDLKTGNMSGEARLT